MRKHEDTGRRGGALGALAILLIGGGCVAEDLAVCEHADGLLYERAEGESCPQVCSDGTETTFDWPADQACPACWIDADGDGFGGEISASSVAEDCPAGDFTDGLAPRGGDCDEGDDNRFPGNPEVCDGADNDCDSETEFFAGEDYLGESAGGARYDCDTYSYMVYLRGGSLVADTAVSPDSPDVTVDAGGRVEGTIKLRVRNLQGAGARLPVVMVAGWDIPTDTNGDPACESAPNRTNWSSLLWEEPPVSTDPPPGTSDREFVVDELVPDCATSGLLIVAASGQTSPRHVAAMSSYEYCGPACGPEDICAPVWSDQFAGMGGDGTLSLANLSEAMLAGCYSYGATFVPWLREAHSPSGAQCNNVDADPDCTPSYGFHGMGCVYIKINVREML